MKCYSTYRPSKDECITCHLRDYCRESTESEPAFLSDSARKIPAEELASPTVIPRRTDNKKIYSRADMIELIGFLVAMDEKTLSIMAEKFQNPSISLAEIGRKKNITRQAIHKLLKKRCEDIPEVAAVFNRKSEKNLTFMEAVCQIKQKSSALNSKEPVNNLNYFRSLTNLSQSLDLSRLSIGKDLNN